VRPILDDDVPRQPHAVAEDYVVADPDVVCDVAVGHQQVVAADAGEGAATSGTSMDGNELADSVTIPDARFSTFAAILQVLRGHANRAVREKDVVLADPGGAFEVVVRHESRPAADLDFGAHHAKRPDFSVLRDSCERIDDGGRMNRHR